MTLRVETFTFSAPSLCSPSQSVYSELPPPWDNVCNRLHEGGQGEVGTCPYSRSDRLHLAPGSTVPELCDPRQVINFSVLCLLICKIKKRASPQTGADIILKYNLK